MVIELREIWWADLPEPVGPAPGHRQSVLVAQSDAFNRIRLATVTVVPLSSNVCLVDAPGNVLIPATASGLPQCHPGVDLLTERVRASSAPLVNQVSEGHRFALDLSPLSAWSRREVPAGSSRSRHDWRCPSGVGIVLSVLSWNEPVPVQAQEATG